MSIVTPKIIQSSAEGRLVLSLRVKSNQNKIFHVNLQDRVIKDPYDFIKESFFLYIPTLLSLLVIDIVVMDIWIYNDFNLSRDIARQRDYMVK